MQDPRFKQANKEARLAIVLALIYFMMWLIGAYALPDGRLFGLPTWFVAAGLLAPLIFIALTYTVIRLFFKTLPLENNTGDH